MNKSMFILKTIEKNLQLNHPWKKFCLVFWLTNIAVLCQRGPKISWNCEKPKKFSSTADAWNLWLLIFQAPNIGAHAGFLVARNNFRCSSRNRNSSSLHFKSDHLLQLISSRWSGLDRIGTFTPSFRELQADCISADCAEK